MIDRKKQKQAARELFVESGMSLKEISAITSVSEKTLCRWAKGENGDKGWKDSRDDLLASPLKIRETLLDTAAKIANGEKPKVKDFDGLSKCVAAIDRLDKKFRITPAVIKNVFKNYDNWLVTVDRQHAVTNAKYQKEYLARKIKDETVKEP
jgi:transcriptional regulator with XRE-family HTH domain